LSISQCNPQEAKGISRNGLRNPEKAGGLILTLHFVFTGREEKSATISIADRKVTVQEGLHGAASLHVRADSATWVRMLNEEISPLKAMVTGKLRLRGEPVISEQVQIVPCIAARRKGKYSNS
jgi:putative sterol carrier protein